MQYRSRFISIASRSIVIMALFSVRNVSLRGVSAAVPTATESNRDYTPLTEKEINLLIKTTGVEYRRRAPVECCTSDYCFEAAKKLLSELRWQPSEVDLLIFVSQSRDYFLPSTAIVLQHRLALPDTALAFDIGLGCSGFVYGTSVIANMMANSGIKKALLLCGDVSTTSVSFHDKSTYPLFGDAGTAAAFEFNEGAEPIHFNLQSDGKGYQSIIIPDGGCRNPLTPESEQMIELEKGVTRRKKDLWLNGMDVFNFSVTKVPVNVNQLLEKYYTSLESLDFFVMHQANLLMNETIRKILGIDTSKVPYSLSNFGNTSSASIPLTMAVSIANELRASKRKLLLSGFGVGLSWGSIIIDTENLVIPDLIEI